MSDRCEGKYRAKVRKWGIEASSKKETPQFKMVVALTALYTAEGQDDAGLRGNPEVIIYRPLTDETIDRFLRDMKEVFAVEVASIAQLDSADANAYDFSNHEVDVRMKFEKYEGQDKERWDFDASGSGKPVTGEKKTTLANLIANAAKRQGYKANGAAAKPAPKPPAAAPSCDGSEPELF